MKGIVAPCDERMPPDWVARVKERYCRQAQRVLRWRANNLIGLANFVNRPPHANAGHTLLLLDFSVLDERATRYIVKCMRDPRCSVLVYNYGAYVPAALHENMFNLELYISHTGAIRHSWDISAFARAPRQWSPESRTHLMALGLGPHAKWHDIKRAYRLKVLELHPDKHRGDAALTDQFIRVQAAYRALRECH